MKLIYVILHLLLFNTVAMAVVKPHNLFTHNMVLQRNMRVPVWGFASADEKVEVQFNGQKQITQSKEGKWMVYLEPMPENSTPLTMTITGANNVVKINNILIGEVWLCAGQSNMEWALFKTTGGEEAIANSTNPLLRIFNVPHNAQMQHVNEIESKWVLSEAKTTKNISGVGYYFLSKLQKELKVPVGFINASYGGTIIEAWLSKEVLAQLPNKDKYMDVDKMKRQYDSIVLKAKPLIEAYEKAKDSAKLIGQPAPPRPQGIPLEFKGTTSIYNGEIYPLIPFAIKGIAWYQGESNAYTQRASTYPQLLTSLIHSWRKEWNRADLPFIVIQLSGDAKKVQENPVESSGKAMLKEAQLQVVQSIKNTVLVTTSDCGELDVHYRDKQPIGARVCNAALAVAYQQKIEYTGPLYRNHEILGNKISIGFTHAENGLIVKSDSVKPVSLYGFAIAGEDKKFYHANAIIEGNKVVVSSANVAKPVAVRYAWADFSFQWNLFNTEGYPASTFRTDTWELK
jgi:sialate O-acetylesterase